MFKTFIKTPTCHSEGPLQFEPCRTSLTSRCPDLRAPGLILVSLLLRLCLPQRERGSLSLRRQSHRL